MKKLIKIAVVLVLLVIVGIVAVFFYIDTIAKTAVEKGATYALGVQTKLKTADVEVLSGRFEMKGLDVANPDGYETSHFLTLGTGDVAVTIGSLTKDLIELPHLKLDTLDVNLEKKDGKSNYQVILDNLKKLESGSKPSAGTGDKRFVIRKLTITNVKAHAELLPIGGQLTKVDVPIEKIELTDVGSDGAIGMSELVGVIFKAVLTAAIKSGGGILPDDILGDLSNQLAGLKDIGKLVDVKNLEGIGTAAEDLGNKAKEGIGKTIGNLLGGDKDKK